MTATERRFTLIDGQAVAEGWDIPAEQAATRSEPAATSPTEPKRVVADWVTHPTTHLETVAAYAARVGHSVGFHAARLPVYLARLITTSPWGLKRLVVDTWRWTRDPDYSTALEAMKGDGVRGDAAELTIRHKQTVRERQLAVTAVSALCCIAVLSARAWRPTWFAAGLVGVVLALGWFGRPVRGVTVVERASFRSPGSPPFTEGLMLEALRTVLGATRGKRDIHVVQPPARTKAGWEAIVRVPGKAADVVAKKLDFAAEIGRPEPCVWLFTSPDESANWLRIVVTRKSLRHMTMPEHPLLNAGPQDYFDMETPVGINPMGDPVTAKKAYRSMVIGGMMGSGKTVSMINSAVGFVSDDRGEIHILDAKGGIDWRPFAKLAHFYVAGSDVEDHERALANLRELNRRVNARFKTLQELPDELASPKTNSQLADLRHLDLHPIMLVIDETQEVFEFAEDAKEYRDLVARLIKKGRAVGITVEGGTQEVSQLTLPISPICHFRYCMMVQSHTQVDQVLATGAYAAGHKADKLTAEDVGIGYFGSGKAIDVVKAYYIDPDDGTLDELCERLAARRKAKALLSGMAAGEIEPDLDLEGPLERVARIWGGASKTAHLVELVAMLHTDRPDDYPAVSADTLDSEDVRRAVGVLSGQLSRHGVTATDLRRRFLPPDGKTSAVRKGIKWDDITRAVEAKQATRSSDTEDNERVTLGAIPLDTAGDNTDPGG